jgi:ATP-binding cassette, subfamily F, member 3
VYAVNREIEEGERELVAARMSKAPPATNATRPSAIKAPRRGEREIRKELSTVEKTVARLDQEKKQALAKMLDSTDAAETLRLHNEAEALAAQLTAAEDRWCQLQEELAEE